MAQEPDIRFVVEAFRLFLLHNWSYMEAGEGPNGEDVQVCRICGAIWYDRTIPMQHMATCWLEKYYEAAQRWEQNIDAF